jgi:hypothetical protein
MTLEIMALNKLHIVAGKTGKWNPNPSFFITSYSVAQHDIIIE